jgi:predicted outer membrane repeat protein
MRKLFTITFIFFTTILAAQTEVNGIQSGIWSYSSSPYIVTGNIEVLQNDSLTIEPGVIVKFQGHYKINVHGLIIAEGTLNDSIYFVPENYNIGWWGIRIDGNSICKFNYCRFEGGKTMEGTFPDQHGGALMLDNADAEITNSVFYENEAYANELGMGGAIYGLNTTYNTVINNCLFINNTSYGEGGAIKFTGDNGAKIHNSSFINNNVLYGGGAICLYGCYSTDIYKNLFVNNETTYSNGGAALIEGYCQQVKFVNCTMYNNNATHGDGGAVEIAFSDASFTNCIIYNNHGAYSDNIFLDFGYAEINYCNTPFPDGAEGNYNINTDAKFVDAENGNFHLTENSPCIDTGIDSLTITDAYNNPITVIDLETNEYNGTAPDMGCYEFDPSTSLISSLESIVNIYPNPTRNYLNFYFNNIQIYDYILWNISGKVINKGKGIPASTILLNKKNGIYFIILETSSGTKSFKLIKQ